MRDELTSDTGKLTPVAQYAKGAAREEKSLLAVPGTIVGAILLFAVVPTCSALTMADILFAAQKRPVQQYWATPGEYYWQVPSGVTSISIVLRGPGGGGYGGSDTCVPGENGGNGGNGSVTISW